MIINLEETFKWRKEDEENAPLKHRQSEKLKNISSFFSGQENFKLLLDTNVYTYMISKKVPGDFLSVIEKSLLYHCSVCLGELSLGLAHDPDFGRFRKTVKALHGVTKNIPKNRLYVPDKEIWLKAGIIAGKLARIQNFQKDQRKELLNDALIFLTAAKHGIPVLTSDRNDYDLIQQLHPDGEFVFYEVAAQSLATPEQQRAPAFVAQAGDQG
ncbi:MAG: type II toxin-antitoxin system VapC family toxin [Alphaproteobacteria bacterium]|nr:type II toxin-antitoxin system VapC family toxin [Alphaproteobacteria bacterium]